MGYKTNYKEDDVELKMNAKRTYNGLGHIGYSPAKAILDILDNGITNGATKGFIEIDQIDENAPLSRVDNIKEIRIIDNGTGMDKQGVIDALAMGASDEAYRDSKSSLSKFGLGLKSASSSLGTVLEVISLKNGEITKLVVDQEKFDDKYKGRLVYPSKEDYKVLEDHNIEHGTIIRISNLHTGVHPGLDEILYDLKSGQNSIGVVYYFFIIKGMADIYLQGEKIEPYDVLYSDEATETFDEFKWTGDDVQWLLRDSEVCLSAENDVKIRVSATILPYTKLRAIHKKENKKDLDEHYKIEASNYGYYVYRNDRLISWADHLITRKGKPVMPQHGEYAIFRGRICIDTSADEYFGIDISKSRIQLSQETYVAIRDAVDIAQKKTGKAYNKCMQVVKDLSEQDSKEKSEEILSEVDIDALLPNEEIPDQKENKRIVDRKKEIGERDKEKLKEETRQKLFEENPEHEPTEELVEQETEKIVQTKFGTGNEKIIYEDSLENNALYMPFFDTVQQKLFVRINKNHKFAKTVYSKINEDDKFKYLAVLFEVYLYECVEAEYRTERDEKDDSMKKKIEKTFSNYKENLSLLLERLIKQKGDIFSGDFTDDNF